MSGVHIYKFGMEVLVQMIKAWAIQTLWICAFYKTLVHAEVLYAATCVYSNDNVELRLTCNTEEQLWVRKAFMAKTPDQTNSNFCGFPSWNITDCIYDQDAFSQSYQEKCNTFSSCKISPEYDRLEECGSEFTGHSYLSVEYQCIPRKTPSGRLIEYITMSTPSTWTKQGTKVLLQSRGYANNWEDADLSKCQLYIQAGVKVKIDIMSLLGRLIDATGTCPYKLYLTNGGSLSVAYCAVKRWQPVTLDTAADNRDSRVDVVFKTEHPTAQGKIWMMVEVTKDAGGTPDNFTIQCGANLQTYPLPKMTTTTVPTQAHRTTAAATAQTTTPTQAPQPTYTTHRLSSTTQRRRTSVASTTDPTQALDTTQSSAHQERATSLVPIIGGAAAGGTAIVVIIIVVIVVAAKRTGKKKRRSQNGDFIDAWDGPGKANNSTRRTGNAYTTNTSRSTTIPRSGYESDLVMSNPVEEIYTEIPDSTPTAQGPKGYVTTVSTGGYDGSGYFAQTLPIPYARDGHKAQLGHQDWTNTTHTNHSPANTLSLTTPRPTHTHKEKRSKNSSASFDQPDNISLGMLGDLQMTYPNNANDHMPTDMYGYKRDLAY